MSPTPLPIPLAPAFDSLSEVEQRRTIVKDALLQLADQRYFATCGTYLAIYHEDIGATEDYDRSQGDQSVRAILQNHYFDAKEVTCKTCALGAIMTSQFRVNGDCPMEEMKVDTRRTSLNIIPYDPRENNEISPFMKRYFSAEQLQLIEIAFELGAGGYQCVRGVRGWQQFGEKGEYVSQQEYYGITIPIESAAMAVSFGRAYKHPTDRLVAILTAIADHPEAEFHP